MNLSKKHNSFFEIIVAQDEYFSNSIDNIVDLIAKKNASKISLDLSGLNIFKAVNIGTIVASKIFVINSIYTFTMIVDNREAYSHLKMLELGNCDIRLKI